jgi:hypothetical protein
MLPALLTIQQSRWDAKTHYRQEERIRVSSGMSAEAPQA